MQDKKLRHHLKMPRGYSLARSPRRAFFTKLLTADAGPGRFLCGALLAGLMAIPATSFAVPVSFGTGSLIIPMDASPSGQNDGMLRAYGLVYELLSNDVPVNWVINPAKTAGGTDFSSSMSDALQDLRTGASIPARSYRGGPFVIAASDAAAALPIISAWQATVGDQTAVHRLGAGSINADVSRALIRAPRIAVLGGGNEGIAFTNLNAAGIPDSLGNTWSLSSPDLLTEAAVAGPSPTIPNDGALFHQPSKVTRYGFFAAMHYNATSTTPSVIPEIRAWLNDGPLTHVFAQCKAAEVFENDPGGRFLTTTGLEDDGSAPSHITNHAPAHPLIQYDGSFETDSGTVDSIRVLSSYKSRGPDPDQPSGEFADRKNRDVGRTDGRGQRQRPGDVSRRPRLQRPTADEFESPDERGPPFSEFHFRVRMRN